MDKKLVVTVRKGGRISTTAEGVKGQACEGLVAGLAKRLGRQTGAEHTAEYYEADASAAEGRENR